VLLLVAGAASTWGQSVHKTEEHAIRVEPVVRGLQHPWSLAFLPDGRMLVTERPGRLRIISADLRLLPQAVAGLPAVAQHGQGGLLDVALHPGFAGNALVYLTYAASGPGGYGTEVVRGRLAGDRLEDVRVIFRMAPKTGGAVHFGARLVFDAEGHLFVTLGERGERDQSQRLDSHLGKIVRLHDDGRIPVDNPFAGRADARAEIWSYGHRNVQGAALHPVTRALWVHEHGPQGGDEVNVVRRGANYGWPVATYGANYGSGTRIGEGATRAGVTPPVHHWVPRSIAPSGMAFYQGDAFPRWRGDVLLGALASRSLVRLRPDGERVVHEERMLFDVLGRVRDVRVGPDGHVWILTDHADGALVRVSPG